MEEAQRRAAQPHGSLFVAGQQKQILPHRTVNNLHPHTVTPPAIQSRWILGRKWLCKCLPTVEQGGHLLHLCF